MLLSLPRRDVKEEFKEDRTGLAESRHHYRVSLMQTTE